MPNPPLERTRRGPGAKPRHLGAGRPAAPATMEERIYHALRCVEGWNMVIPGWATRWPHTQRSESLGSADFSILTQADPSTCPACAVAAWIGPTPKACAWTKPCTPDPADLWHVWPRPAQPKRCPVRLVVQWKYGFKTPKAWSPSAWSSACQATAWLKRRAPRIRLLPT